MSRYLLEMADVIAQFGSQLQERHSPTSYQLRVLQALLLCRTAALGGHKDRCDCCGQERISYNSCRNRHCPKCQSARQAVWIENLLETTLPVKHYHLVFTVPHELNAIAMLDSRWFYSQLFASVWETIYQLGYTRYGVEGGAVCVLHTWGQNLSLHPHLHCIVPAAGESLAGSMKPIGHQGKYLYPVRQLSVVFRGKLMEAIGRHLKKNLKHVLYQPLLKEVWAKPWVVFCEPSMAKAEHVVRYLGQYTHRVAITNQRIISIDDQRVTFTLKDYRDGAIQKPATLDGVEFLRRFCLHILPHRFVKIRRYGIYSSRYRSLRQKQDPKMVVDLKPKESMPERLLRLTGVDLYRCPVCKQGTMCRIEELPRIRSPAGLRAPTSTNGR
jgi:hypothetical protein